MRTSRRARWAVVAALSLGFTTAMSMGSAAFAAPAPEDGPIDRVEVAFGGQVGSWESGDELPTCSDFSPVSLEFSDSGPVKLTLCANAEVDSVFAHVPNAGALDLLLQGDSRIDTPADFGKPSLQVWDGDLNIYGAEEGTQPPKVLEISAEGNEAAIELQGGFALSVGKPGTPSVIVDVLDGWAPSPSDVVIDEGNEYLYEGGDDPGGAFRWAAERQRARV